MTSTISATALWKPSLPSSDNPTSSPAVLLRTAMFILQRLQLPKIGWSMPEPAPDPDGKKLLDSAIIEQDHDSLPGLCNIERDMQTDDPASAESAAPAETPSETETPVDSATSETPPPPDSPGPPPPPCNPPHPIAHDSQKFDDVAL